MENNELLSSIAFIISIIVIICLTLVFSILYYLYGKYKRKHINNGSEDNKLLIEINEENKKLKQKADKEINREKKSFRIIFKEELYKFFHVKLKLKFTNNDNKLSIGKIIFSLIYSLFVLFVVFVVGVSISYRVNNETLFIGDSTYFTVKTESMASIHEDNDYILENNLEDQIPQYSLITIEKVKDINDIEVYDILAFRVNDVVYVHRVIDIIFDNGDIYFTLKGDANPTSLLIETKVNEEQIIGIYNGNNSLFMGIAITYLQSEIGLIALFMSIAFLINVEIQEYLIDNTYEKRKKILNSNNLISNDNKGEINNDN